MRACSITLACALAACGSPRSSPPGAAPEPPPAPDPAPADVAAAPDAPACDAHPCAGERYVVVAAGASHDVSTGETIVVREVTADGAVRLEIDGEPLALARRPGAAPGDAVGWGDGARVELAAIQDGAAWLIVHVVTGEITATETVRVERGATVHPLGAALTFDGHNHKHVKANQRSPLLVLVDHHDGHGVVEHSLYPPDRPTWRWQDLRFTLGAYRYDDHMVLTVERVALRRVE